MDSLLRCCARVNEEVAKKIDDKSNFTQYTSAIVSDERNGAAGGDA